MSPNNGRAVCWAIRIRPEIRINNDLFPEDPPDFIYCTVIEREIGSETIDDTWNYHLKNYGSGPPGTHTTYHAIEWWREPEVWLGKYSFPGLPDSPPPDLRTHLNPDIQYVYNVVIIPAPYLQVPPPPPTIAWAKTVNFISDPEGWWTYNQQEQRFELNRQPPQKYIDVFNNFPHPCGPIFNPPEGWPSFWPDPDDSCHLDWCKHSLWPEYLGDAEHSDMRLIMLINEWGTWEQLFAEPIYVVPPWVL